MRVDDFDYELPQELIAQHPIEPRDASRLLVVDRSTGKAEHRRFFGITEYLQEGDCLVLNDSRVIQARLLGRKEGSGIEVEFLLSRRAAGGLWETLVRPGRRLKTGDRVSFGEKGELSAEIVSTGEQGTRLVRFSCEGRFEEVLERVGRTPLPPYIERASTSEDKSRYQTVYCREDGSVAAPTAGLHFTPELLEKIEEKGIKTAFVTLHVGIGTFRPVKCEEVEEHVMHFEEYSVSEECADTVNSVRRAGGRIVAVGTTSARTLESASSDGGELVPGSGDTGIFIYPGYEFKIVDALITNFHLPKSTLLMLVSAFYDREKMLDVYAEAVRERYRFFSYGDAMFLYDSCRTQEK